MEWGLVCILCSEGYSCQILYQKGKIFQGTGMHNKIFFEFDPRRYTLPTNTYSHRIYKINKDSPIIRNLYGKISPNLFGTIPCQIEGDISLLLPTSDNSFGLLYHMVLVLYLLSI